MSLSLVLQALREPARFAVAHGGPARAPDDPRLFGALSVAAAIGMGAFGAALHASAGATAMIVHGVGAAAAAGAAWAATLPALYVVGTLTGSRLDARTLVLASLVTVSFGGLAMLASVPVLWFFELALPGAEARLVVSALSFAGVGLCMADVFIRVMRALGGLRVLHLAWLGLLGAVGLELFVVTGLFHLT